MSPKGNAARNGKTLLLAANSLAAFLITALTLRHGMSACSDSWFYWQGSVSLIEHGKYTTISGEPIMEWPPLFSMFLALFQIPLSQTGWTLALVMSVLSAMIAGAWTAYVFKVFAVDGALPKSAAFAGSIIFVPLFAVRCGQELMSHALLLFFLGLLFNYLASIADGPGQWTSLKKPSVVGLILAIAMLTHNSTLIFAAATALVIVASSGGHLPRRLMAAVGVLFISLTPWIIVRHLLGQGGSHSVSKPKFGFMEYVNQVPRELGVFFISSNSYLVQESLGVIILATAIILWTRSPHSVVAKRHRVLIGLALVALAGHFVLFNLVWIDAAIGGRFTWFFALAIAPIFFCVAGKRLLIVVPLLLLTVGVSGWRVAKLVWNGETAPLTIISGEKTPNVIYCSYFLTSRADAQIPAGAVEVQVPIFSWQTTASGAKGQTEITPVVKLLNAPH